MTAILPESLFRTKRGLCPACGAPLKLGNDAQTSCGFCGQSAVLERRLRKIEPEVPDAPLRLYIDRDSAEAGDIKRARWTRSKQYREGLVGSANCPGCGDELEYRDDASSITCRTCGTECRLERRLWMAAPDPATEVPNPRHPEERHHSYGRKDVPPDPDTEHLIYRIIHEQNRDHRLRLAGDLGSLYGSWSHINATTARLLPTLLEATKGAEPAFQSAVADCVGKLLCQGSAELRNAAIRAVERFIFDETCPPPIIFEAGLGDGVCCKPLLDAAEFAVREGHIEYACWCLRGVEMIFERNYDDHEIMGQIILYRMLYLTGPVLAFAFLLAQRQRGIGFYYKPETLLAFIDDAAVERPGLLPELDKSFYCGWPKDDAEFEQRLAFYQSLKTDAARGAALRHWLRVPENATDKQYRRMFDFLLPPWDDAGPLKSAAETALEAVAGQGYPTPDAMHQLVKERGRSLPIEVQRGYLQNNRDTPYLSYEGLPYWESKPEPKLTPEMQQAMDQWKEGLHKAVDSRDAEREGISERFNQVRELEVEIYDGKHDGPAPPWLAKRLAKEARDARDDDEDDVEDSEATEQDSKDDDDDEDRPPPGEPDPQMLDAYRQAIQQLEGMKEMVRAISPDAVKQVDEQIEQIRKMYPGKL